MRWEKDYIWAGSRLIAVEDASGRQHIHPDHLGSTRLVTDSSGNRLSYHEYYPLGMELTQPYQDDIRMKFTGHERDSLAPSASSFFDVDYMHARTYSLLFGRFTSLDPAPANPSNPQSWHPYAYVLNNPIRFRDPFGLEPSDKQTSGCLGDSAAADSICVGQNPMTYRDLLPMIAAIAPGKNSPVVEKASIEGNVSFPLGGFGKTISESLEAPVPVLIDLSATVSKNEGFKLSIAVSPGSGFSASLLAVYSESVVLRGNPSKSAEVLPVGFSIRGGNVLGGGIDVSSDLGNVLSGNFYADIDFKLGLATPKSGSGRVYRGEKGFNAQTLGEISWRPWPLW